MTTQQPFNGFINLCKTSSFNIGKIYLSLSHNLCRLWLNLLLTADAVKFIITVTSKTYETGDMQINLPIHCTV